MDNCIPQRTGVARCHEQQHRSKEQALRGLSAGFEAIPGALCAGVRPRQLQSANDRPEADIIVGRLHETSEEILPTVLHVPDSLRTAVSQSLPERGRSGCRYATADLGREHRAIEPAEWASRGTSGARVVLRALPNRPERNVNRKPCGFWQLQFYREATVPGIGSFCIEKQRFSDSRTRARERSVRCPRLVEDQRIRVSSVRRSSHDRWWLPVLSQDALSRGGEKARRRKEHRIFRLRWSLRYKESSLLQVWSSERLRSQEEQQIRRLWSDALRPLAAWYSIIYF